MIQNLNHILEQQELDKITAELDRNVRQLFQLGKSHFSFAQGLGDKDWRQKISRLYYAAYNVRRAVALKNSGAFSTESGDHQKVDQLPDNMDNRESHLTNLRNLREDRNLSDYNHEAKVTDLVLNPGDALNFVTQFLADSAKFLKDQGVTV